MELFQQLGGSNMAQTLSGQAVIAFLLMLVLSISCAFVISLVAFDLSRRFFESDRRVTILYPLLALSMTAIFHTLQGSVPLSLGLLGSLSIVRFRTPIRNPLEIGFILSVIAVSLLAATRSYVGLAVLMTIIILAYMLLASDYFHLREKFLPQATAIVHLPHSAVDGAAGDLMAELSGFGRDIVVSSLIKNDREWVASLRLRKNPRDKIRLLTSHFTAKNIDARVDYFQGSVEWDT